MRAAKKVSAASAIFLEEMEFEPLPDKMQSPQDDVELDECQII